MLVKDILRTSVSTIRQEATLREVVTLLSTACISGLPVLNDDGDMVGIITEHDVIKAILPTYEDILSTDIGLLSPNMLETRFYEVQGTPISSIMTKNVVILEENDSILKAATTMILKKVKLLPVLKDRKPVGVVNRIDIVQALMQCAQ